MEQEAPLSEGISVIIPVYNDAPYIALCLNSLLKQQYPHWEAICIDDGSEDDGAALLDDYATKDVRIRVVHTENRGVSAARNTALTLVTKPYFTLLDADDILPPHALLTYAAMLSTSGADIAIASFAGIVGGKIYPAAQHLPEGTFSLNYRALRHISLCGWGKAYKTSHVTTHGIRFREELHVGEDCLFVLSYLSHASRVTVSDAALYLKVNAPDSVIKRCSEGKAPRAYYLDNLRMPLLAMQYVKQSCADGTARTALQGLILRFALMQREKQVSWQHNMPSDLAEELGTAYRTMLSSVSANTPSPMRLRVMLDANLSRIATAIRYRWQRYVLRQVR